MDTGASCVWACTFFTLVGVDGAYRLTNENTPVLVVFGQETPNALCMCLCACERPCCCLVVLNISEDGAIGWCRDVAAELPLPSPVFSLDPVRPTPTPHTAPLTGSYLLVHAIGEARKGTRPLEGRGTTGRS